MPGEDDKPKKLSRFEKIIGIATLVLSIGTLFVGWKTFQLSESTAATESDIKRLTAEIQSQRLGFDRVRDIYDRIQKYLASEQKEREGRALVALIRSMPESEHRYEFLSILSANVKSNPVAIEAAEIYTAAKQLPSTADNSEFIGNLVFEFVNDGRTAVLQEDFGFIDSEGKRWVAPAGTATDGASVPVAIRSFVGSPFDDRFIKAAVIHDYYVTTRESSPEATNKMFYEALLAAGNSELTSKTLYAALQSFGPRWK